MAHFIVTIQRVITTKVTVEADSATSAAKYVTNYGISEYAVDMSTQDAKVTEKISRVDKIK